MRMRKTWVAAAVLLSVCAFIAPISAATLSKIGTATWDGKQADLIFEDSGGGKGLVWLDYVHPDPAWRGGEPVPSLTWADALAWANGLGSGMTVNLDPLYMSTLDWTTGWRLPSAGIPSTAGQNTASEMGHLYKESLGLDWEYGSPVPWWNPAQSTTNRSLFEDALAQSPTLFSSLDSSNMQIRVFWTGSEARATTAWVLHFYNSQTAKGGNQYELSKEFAGAYLAALAVLPVMPGEITYVPLPAAGWLFLSALAGLGGLTWRTQQRSAAAAIRFDET